MRRILDRIFRILAALGQALLAGARCGLHALARLAPEPGDGASTFFADDAEAFAHDRLMLQRDAEAVFGPLTRQPGGAL